MHRLPLPTAVKGDATLLHYAEKPSPIVGETRPRETSTFEVLTPRGHLNCTLTEPLARDCDAEPLKGVLILIHAPPIGDSMSSPLTGLAQTLAVGTVRVDLTGCGASTGEPLCNSVDRDADDIRCVVEHVRHMHSVSRLKARAKGERLGDDTPAVLGLVGVGGGGTAVVRYAALFLDDPLQFIITIAARVSCCCALRDTLTWKQLDAMRDNEDVEVTLPLGPPPQPRRTLRVTQEDYDAVPDLSCAGSSSSHFLILHGSRDTVVLPAEAQALDKMLAADGSNSRELRVLPGMGSAEPRAGDSSSMAGQEATVAYAIGDWMWRKTHGDDGDGAASGFNIFVDDLGKRVREIHAEARGALPSINNFDDDSDEEEEGKF